MLLLSMDINLIDFSFIPSRMGAGIIADKQDSFVQE